MRTDDDASSPGKTIAEPDDLAVILDPADTPPELSDLELRELRFPTEQRVRPGANRPAAPDEHAAPVGIPAEAAEKVLQQAAEQEVAEQVAEARGALDEPLPGAPRIGSVLRERYRLTSVIGRGGMADVYRATDELLDRPVAVKVFRPGTDRHADRKRFLGEVHTLAGLSHPNLVALYDGGQNDAQPWCVMQLVDGGTLADREDPLDPAQAAALAAQIAEGLAHIHERRIVHRDVKPSNVLLDDEGGAYLSDFGVAQLVDATRMTSTGTLLGTAAYLSPEQVRGVAASPAVDVYALGLVVLESITGRREYPGAPVESAVARLSRQPVVPAGLGPDWQQLLTSMTDADPARRPSAANAARTLRALSVHSDVVPFAAPPSHPSGLPRVPAPSQPVDGSHPTPAPGPSSPARRSTPNWTPSRTPTSGDLHGSLPALSTIRPEFHDGTDGLDVADDADAGRFGGFGRWVGGHTGTVMVGLGVLVAAIALSVPALNRSGGLIQLDSSQARTQESSAPSAPGIASTGANLDWTWQADQPSAAGIAPNTHSRGVQDIAPADRKTSTYTGRPATNPPAGVKTSTKASTPVTTTKPSGTTPTSGTTTGPTSSTTPPTSTKTSTSSSTKNSSAPPPTSETTTSTSTSTPPASTGEHPSSTGGTGSGTGGTGGGGLEVPTSSGPASSSSGSGSS